MSRGQISSAKRIVIKVGSSTLTGKAGAELDPSAVDRLVDLVASCRMRGAEVVVVSSGAIATGLVPLGLKTRPRDLATQQAAAAVGQGLLMHRYTESFARHQINAAQILLTTQDVIHRSHYKNAQRTLYRLLALGVVPIINENDTVGTQEIRFGDNDRLAALVSLVIGADLLVLISDIDALYDAAPSQPNAKRISDVKSVGEIDEATIGGVGASGVGSGGMVTKVEAARISTSAGIAMLLTSLPQSEQALNGEDVGTYFQAHHSKTNSRLLWLAHASTPNGRLTVDAGAVTALIERGVSLLPAGVTSVEGEFSAGDAVEIAAQDGRVIARGLVAFDSSEIPQMLGRSTKEIAKELGAEYERELIHRDDLVLL